MRRALYFVFFFLISLFSCVALIERGFSWTFFLAFAVFGFFSILLAFQDLFEKKKLERIEAAKCIFKEDHIYFPRGYYYRYGFMSGRKDLPYASITEARLNTFPKTVLVNSNEVIFLPSISGSDLEKAMTEKGIPCTNPEDPWSLICEEFLDTEFGENEKEQTLQTLENCGITRDETLAIRKQLRRKMMALTFATWEWAYYGQYDVLSVLRPLTAKKYWWTMEIALRNYK